MIRFHSSGRAVRPSEVIAALTAARIVHGAQGRAGREGLRGGLIDRRRAIDFVREAAAAGAEFYAATADTPGGELRAVRIEQWPRVFFLAWD